MKTSVVNNAITRSDDGKLTVATGEEPIFAQVLLLLLPSDVQPSPNGLGLS